MHASSMPSVKSRLFSCSRRAAIAFLACVTIGAPNFSSTATATPQASTIAALAKIRAAWVQDLRTQQLEPILKFYAPDTVFLQPTGERLTGSAALLSLLQNIMATFNSDLTLHSQNLETSGDLAYDSGDFQEILTSIATGARITSKGSYIIIFRRQAWKLANRSADLDRHPASWRVSRPSTRRGGRFLKRALFAPGLGSTADGDRHKNSAHLDIRWSNESRA